METTNIADLGQSFSELTFILIRESNSLRTSLRKIWLQVALAHAFNQNYLLDYDSWLTWPYCILDLLYIVVQHGIISMSHSSVFIINSMASLDSHLWFVCNKKDCISYKTDLHRTASAGNRYFLKIL